ncbi:hypothetical protein WR25_17441 [Diploscapter pachys]|uniref:Uncharacterized protein n=1 Tax=Diploscapter pachys TaxID=2018661 RepID=A0A2A2K3B2_9BILA|nr:hypothetical protein WR25_17441 [Diploscapter pachys]
MPSVTPISARVSADTPACVVDAGCVISERESPMLLEMSISASASSSPCAWVRSATSNAKIGPVARIWLIASACCGWLGRPGCRIFGTRASRKRPTVSALSACRVMRRSSVSSPFNTTQALNADSVGPVLRVKGNSVLRGRGEGIVDHGRDAAFPRNGADGADVDHVHRRIGRRFEEEDLRFGPHRVEELLRIACIDDRGLDAELGQQRIGQPAARSERRAPADQMIARLQLTQQHRGHRRHARCHRPARLGPFQQRDPLFQHFDRRILQTGIGHPLLLTREPRRGIARLVVGIARGEEQRLARLAIFAAGRAATDGQRRGAPVGGDRTVLTCLALHAARFAGRGRGVQGWGTVARDGRPAHPVTPDSFRGPPGHKGTAGASRPYRHSPS